MSQPIDFFFFIGSTYTYLSVCRAAALAEREHVELRWRPFSVRTIMREQDNIPFAGKPVKLRYMWRDIERRAHHHGVPFAKPPSAYPVDADERANRIATLAAIEGWCPAFTRAAYAAWFIDDHDPGDAATLSQVLRRIGRDPEETIERADRAAVRARYAAETDAARALGIFGSPTFVCGDEIFWGDDRFEDAIAWSRSR